MATTLLTSNGDIVQGGITPIQVPSSTQPDLEYGFQNDQSLLIDPRIQVDGVPGPQGPEGLPGRSIDRVEQTDGDSSPGTVDEYTIYYTRELLPGIDAASVSVDTTNFDNNLDSSITDVQLLADAVDELVSGASGGVTTVDIDPNITVGGVTAADFFAAGTSYEDIFSKLMTSYIAPKLNSLSISSTPSGSTVEVGATITINSATISSTNDNEGSAPFNPYISGPGFNKAATLPTTTADASTTVQKTTDTSQSWTATAEDKNGTGIPSRSASIVWRFRHFVGASSTVLTGSSTDAQATTLLDGMQIDALRANKSASITLGSYADQTGWYTYIGYAAKYTGLNNIIQNGSLSVLGAFTLVGTFDYTNAEGHVEPYYIYKSNSDKAFANGTTLTIS